MLSYLRAVGYKPVNNKPDFNPYEDIVEFAIGHADRIRKILLDDGRIFGEIYSSVTKETGILVFGEYDNQDRFIFIGFVPFVKNEIPSIRNFVSVRYDEEDNIYIGTSMDLHYGGMVQYQFSSLLSFYDKRLVENLRYHATVFLSALSIEGKIILGLHNENSGISYIGHNSMLEREELLFRVAKNEEEAFQLINKEKADSIEIFKKRLKKDDLYSIIESSMVLCEEQKITYLILGTIINWRKFHSEITGEQIFKFLVACNNIIMSVCINENDLIGVPAIGRRFKGTVCMQGRVDFNGVLT